MTDFYDEFTEMTEEMWDNLLRRYKDFPYPNAERNAGDKNLVKDVQGEAAPKDSLGDHKDIVG